MTTTRLWHPFAATGKVDGHELVPVGGDQAIDEDRAVLPGARRRNLASRHSTPDDFVFASGLSHQRRHLARSASLSWVPEWPQSQQTVARRTACR